MTTISVTPPYERFDDAKGESLESGFIYIGGAGQNPLISDNWLATFTDAALTTPLAQPVRTHGGYPVNNGGSPVQIYVGAGDYSIVIQDKNGDLVSSSLSNKTKLGLIDLSTDVTGLLPTTSLKYNQTAAELAAGVTPTNTYIPDHTITGTLLLNRYGGASGAGDNTAAMNQAQLVAAQLGGGTIEIPYAGEWRMNFICTINNLWIRGAGGEGEFDVYCIRPFSLLSAPLIFGTGLVNIRYNGLDNVHVSGTDAPGTYVPGGTPTTNPNSVLTVHSAPHAVLLKGGVIGFRMTESCCVYGGIRSVSCEPSATNPVTGARIYGIIRNDNTDSVNARCWYEERLADPGYITDNVCFAKGNGPTLGYACEFKNNGGPGIVGEFAGNPYFDVKPFHGIKLTGNAGIRPENLDLDPGSTLVGVIESDQVLADINRFISGRLRHGGQSFVFSGSVLDTGTLQAGTTSGGTLRAAATFADNELAGQTIKITGGTGVNQYRRIISNVGATDVFVISPDWTVIPNAASTYDIYRTVDIPTESDEFTFKSRFTSATFAGPRNLCVAGGALNQYPTSTQWELQNLVGPDRLTGADLEVMKAIRLFGSNASLSATFDSIGAGGGLRMDAQGSNQNIRVIPSGTGQVVLEGNFTRPSGDNTQSLGSAGNRWSVVFAGTGAINTSDERVKDQIEDIPAAWLEAWGQVQWMRFKFKDALVEKGDGARWHVGLIAQRVVQIFKDHGLDATEIGLVCYESWEDEFEEVREAYEVEGVNGPMTLFRLTGEKRLVRPAGNLWSMRYDEALVMECAYLRSRLP